jgi:hypothetical protein
MCNGTMRESEVGEAVSGDANFISRRTGNQRPDRIHVVQCTDIHAPCCQTLLGQGRPRAPPSSLTEFAGVDIPGRIRRSRSYSWASLDRGLP